jgi:hypothetical protein
VLAVIVTKTGRYICSVSSYCDNNANNGEIYYVVLTVIVKIIAITGPSMSRANSYCDSNDNNGEVCMQC